MSEILTSVVVQQDPGAVTAVVIIKSGNIGFGGHGILIFKKFNVHV